MATHLIREMMRGLAALRYEPTSKRIRALAGRGERVLGLDSQVWQHTGLASGTWPKVAP